MRYTMRAVLKCLCVTMKKLDSIFEEKQVVERANRKKVPLV